MVNILEHDGQPAFAVVPFETYQAMLSKLEDIDDIQDFDAITAALKDGSEEFLPADMVNRILNGESTVKVWREHRKLSQKELSEKSGVRASMLSQIETGKKSGSIDTLKKLATALNIDLDDLV